MLRSIVFLVFIFLFTSSAQAEFRTFCKHTGSGKLSFYSVDVPCSGKNVKITREQFCEAGGTGVQSEYDQICWKFQSSTESNNSKVSYPVNFEEDYWVICDLLDCEARQEGDDFEFYLKQFLKGKASFDWPYLAVTKYDIGSSIGVGWAMDSSYSGAINSCSDYSDDCIVIIENGKITNQYFLKKFLAKRSTDTFIAYSDYEICNASMLYDGSGWVTYNRYVEEAMSRSLTIYDCRTLLNIQSKPKNSRGGR